MKLLLKRENLKNKTLPIMLEPRDFDEEGRWKTSLHAGWFLLVRFSSSVLTYKYGLLSIRNHRTRRTFGTSVADLQWVLGPGPSLVCTMRRRLQNIPLEFAGWSSSVISFSILQCWLEKTVQPIGQMGSHVFPGLPWISCCNCRLLRKYVLV